MQKALTWATALCGLMMPMAFGAQAQNVELRATLAKAASKQPTGIYKLTESSPIKTTLLTECAAASDLLNASYYDGTVYGFSAKTNSSYQTTYYLYTIDAETGESTRKSISSGNYATAQAVNPITKKVVGYSPFSTKFFEYDPATESFTDLDFIYSTTFFYALAYNASGELYGASYDQANNVSLYKIDIEAKNVINIGSTGTQSTNPELAIDRKSGKMYLATPATFGSSCSFYILNPSTAKATLVGSMDTNQQLTGFYIEEKADENESQIPGAPTDVKITFKSLGSKAAVLTAKAPTIAFDQSSTMTAPMTITFFVDEVEVGHQDNINPGEYAAIDYTFETEGSHWVRVQSKSSAGDGLTTSKSTFVGLDTPAGVTDATLTIDADGKVKINWTAPEMGANNGQYDQQALRYEIKSYPDKKIVATDLKEASFATSIAKPFLNNYSYGITAICGDLRSEEVRTNRVLYGEGIRLPFVEDFQDDDTWALHTVIDEANDGSWAIFDNGGGARWCRYTGTKNQAADWLFTPCIKMREGVTYQLEFTYAAAFNQSAQLRVFLMDKPEVPYGGADAMTPLRNIVYGETDLVTATLTYTAESDGNRYFAFFTDNYPNVHLNLHKYVITASSAADSPADVDDFKVKAADKGEFSATVSFTAPTKRVNGTNLADDELTAIEIYKGTSKKPVKVFENPTPGEKLEYVDDSAFHGLNSYTVSTFSDTGNSNGVSASVWVGEDYSDAVKNLKVVVDNEAGNINVSWDAPTTGVQGGWVDFDNLTYNLSIFVSASTEDYVTLQSGLKECHTVLRLDDIKQWIPRGNNGRASMSILITPVTSAGNGRGAVTGIVLGEAYTMPFEEHFGNNDGPMTQTDPWTVTVLQGSGVQFYAVAEGPSDVSLKGLTPQDGDKGMVMFYEKSAQFGEGRFLGPIINIEGTHPVMSFWMYHRSAVDTENNYLVIETQNAQGEYVEISERIPVNGFGWQEHEIDLSERLPEGLKQMRLIFHGKASGGTEFFFDNVSIDDADNAKFPAPQNLTAVLNADETKVTLSWEAPKSSDYTLIGYYIYRDGVKVSNNYTTALTYEVAFPADNKAHYFEVQAIYNEGDSRRSNRVDVVPSAIEGVDAEGVNIFTTAGGIVIEATATDYVVVNAAGVVVARGVAEGRQSVELTAGVYIVKAGKKTSKVVVR